MFPLGPAGPGVMYATVDIVIATTDITIVAKLKTLSLPVMICLLDCSTVCSGVFPIPLLASPAKLGGVNLPVDLKIVPETQTGCSYGESFRGVSHFHRHEID